jgi:hypothetical protein
MTGPWLHDHSMDAALAGLIGAFGGAGIGLLGALKVNADQRQEAERSERRRAFAVCLGALYPVVSELREMPPNSEPDALTRAIDQLLGEQASWVRTRRGLAATSPQMFGRMDRLSAAMAVVQTLAMPAALLEAVEAANDYVAELGEERSEELVARWPAVRARLLEAARLL